MCSVSSKWSWIQNVSVIQICNTHIPVSVKLYLAGAVVLNVSLSEKGIMLFYPRAFWNLYIRVVCLYSQTVVSADFMSNGSSQFIIEVLYWAEGLYSSDFILPQNPFNGFWLCLSLVRLELRHDYLPTAQLLSLLNGSQHSFKGFMGSFLYCLINSFLCYFNCLVVVRLENYDFSYSSNSAKVLKNNVLQITANNSKLPHFTLELEPLI